MRVHSSGDMLAFVAELNARRMADVLGRVAKKQGGMLNLPKLRHDQMKIVRELHYRYRNGDYRHDSHEAGICIDFANWLIEQHAATQGVSPRFPDFDVTKLETKTPCTQGLYQSFIGAVHSGLLDGDS